MRRHPLVPLCWVDRLEPGDVVVFRSGIMRTVLDVFRRSTGKIVMVRFTILHCSWTKRPITTCDRWVLRKSAKGVHGRRRRHPVALKAMASMSAMPGDRKNGYMTCCDVEGVY